MAEVMKTITLEELDHEHFFNFDQFIPIYLGKKLDIFQLNYQLADVYEPNSVAVLVSHDGTLGVEQLARKFDAIGMSYTQGHMNSWNTA